MFVVSLIGLAILIICLPDDYFVSRQRKALRQRLRNPILWTLLAILKNAIGAILLLAGIAMLVLPGQGLLSILIGISLMNFPGKYALERKLIRRPVIHNSMNRIRRKVGRTPLHIP